MKITTRLLIIVGLLGSLTACQSMPTRPVSLDEHLQRYIGSSSQDIRNNLDLKALCYSLSDQIIQTKSQLSYTILRPLSIPLAGSVAPVEIGPSGVPIIRHEMVNTPTYDINFNCKVTFKLENNIATSIQYVGRAC